MYADIMCIKIYGLLDLFLLLAGICNMFLMLTATVKFFIAVLRLLSERRSMFYLGIISTSSCQNLYYHLQLQKRHSKFTILNLSKRNQAYQNAKHKLRERPFTSKYHQNNRWSMFRSSNLSMTRRDCNGQRTNYREQAGNKSLPTDRIRDLRAAITISITFSDSNSVKIKDLHLTLP